MDKKGIQKRQRHDVFQIRNLKPVSLDGIARCHAYIFFTLK